MNVLTAYYNIKHKVIFMKNLFYILIIIFMSSGCQQIGDMNDFTQIESKSISRYSIRTLEEALEIASQAPVLFETPSSRSVERTTNLRSHYAILNVSSRSSMPDTLLYIINYDDNRGYAVVSANPEGDGLLAYADNGTYTDSSRVVNKGLDAILDNMAVLAWKPIFKGDTITPIDTTNLGDNNRPIRYQTKTETSKEVVAHIEPKVKVVWAQDYPESFYCKNYVTGCVPLAVAQILSYFELPKQIAITYDGSDSNLEIDWSLIKQHSHTNGTHNNCALDFDAHMPIAMLCREIGERANANYSQKNITTATLDGAKRALESIEPLVKVSNLFSYDYTDILSWQQLASNISNGIVLIKADGRDGKVEDGHTWICDGYKSVVITSKTYSKPENSLLWTLDRTDVEKKNYLHHNWGFGGKDNGYFLMHVMSPKYGSEYDSANNVHVNRDYSFNYNIGYMVVSK